MKRESKAGRTYQTLTDAEQVTRAWALVRVAHAGQEDKNGRPYLGHIERVHGYLLGLAEYAALSDADRWTAQVAAILHDVVEDTPFTSDDLRVLGFGDAAVDTVILLTAVKNEPREAYRVRIAQSPVARAVKAADLTDNTDPARLAEVEALEGFETRNRLEIKYARDREVLGLEDPWSKAA